jgi:hypothetical protein
VNKMKATRPRSARRPATMLCGIPLPRRRGSDAAEIRAVVGVHRGRTYLDIREWVEVEGPWIATPKGINLKAGHLGQIREAIEEALSIAEDAASVASEGA